MGILYAEVMSGFGFEAPKGMLRKGCLLVVFVHVFAHTGVKGRAIHTKPTYGILKNNPVMPAPN